MSSVVSGLRISTGRNTAVEHHQFKRMLFHSTNKLSGKRAQSSGSGKREETCRVGWRAAGRVMSMAASGSASTMRIRIQGRHMEATPAIKEFVEEKVTKVR